MATLTPTGGLADLDPDLVDRRPTPALLYPAFHHGGHGVTVASRRPGPSGPLVAGTVDPSTAKAAWLVDVATDSIIDQTTVDPVTGDFNFNRVWLDPTAHQYGIRFLAPSGFSSQTFPCGAPAFNQFNGNPSVISSAGGARP